MPEDIKTLLEFPCAFPIKAMGKAEGDFQGLVVGLLRRHAPDLDETQIRVRASRGGKWLSVTVTIEATSKGQLDAIYRDLSAHDRVVWAM